ncbi:CUT1 family carbohydrate ABC transporter membrane protein 2 [Neobacillus bataviensis LMG 21833]|uniref:CUT1 family carbohydrate ABC transporter membrane protein 2 n=1 Tax=Neobacillus bataviensis LMG 21833 TaxID=1117379 RepID=K6C231_9BACI|nr:carbohydrate ABC transporter permease [Neobacillus bataviensis]EKN65205.1 CUT1 family carbohydrate ABC transporter membrane protein 2 [Neobacillus bataviensis LMG 21833]
MELKIKRRTPNRSLYGDIFNVLALLAVASFMALPLVYAVNNAFKPLEELFQFPPKFFVRHPTFDNIRDLFTLMNSSWVPFTRYIFNTVFITVIGSFLHLVVASLAAYVLAKHKFPGQKMFFSMVILALMFSPHVTAIPNYLIMAKIGWIDSYLSLIVPAIAAPLGVFLMKQFMEQIPVSLLESARLDGANEFYVFWKVAMPLVKPAWLTLLIFSFQALWSLNGGTFIYNEALKTLPTALNQIVATGFSRAGAASAIALFMMVVPLSVFIVSQSNVIETMSTSGIKD